MNQLARPQPSPKFPLGDQSVLVRVPSDVGEMVRLTDSDQHVPGRRDRAAAFPHTVLAATRHYGGLHRVIGVAYASISGCLGWPIVSRAVFTPIECRSIFISAAIATMRPMRSGRGPFCPHATATELELSNAWRIHRSASGPTMSMPSRCAFMSTAGELVRNA